MADKDTSSSKVDYSTAIYHDISQTTLCAVRFFGVTVALMVIVSFILALLKGTDNPTFYLLACNVVISSFVSVVLVSFILALLKGTDNPTFYLLACNVVISSFVSVVLMWWYRGGDLQADKYWLLLLLGGVIAIQSITTDIYVFHVIPVPQDQTTTTLMPNFSTLFTTQNTTNKSMDFTHFTQTASVTPMKLTTVDYNGF